MNEIVITGDNTLSIETENKIVEIQRQIKKLQAIDKALREELKDEMSKRGMVGIKTEKLRITYVPSYEKESIDSKRLKEENLDLYNEYCKISSVKDTVKVEVL